MRDKDLDQLYRDKFKSFNPSVPEGVWSRIETEVPKKRVKNGVRKYYPWLSIAAAMVAVCLGIWFWTNDFVREDNSQRVPVDFIDKKSQANRLESEKNVVENRKSRIFNEARTARKVYADKKIRTKASVIVGISRTKHQREEISLDDIGVIKTTTPRTMALELKSVPDAMRLNMFSSLRNIDLASEASDQAAYKESQLDMKSVKRKTHVVGVSTILNFVVNTIQKDDEVIVSFSEDQDGILKVDLSHLLTKR